MKCPCGKAVVPLARGRGRYCSNPCKYRFRKRPTGLRYQITKKNPAWFQRKETVKPDGHGYVRRRINGKMKRVHVVVAEQMIGRALRKDEVVHHLNGIKTDNRPSNLEVMKKKDHDHLHKGKKLCAV